MENAEIVKGMYEAFGRGDVAAIIEPLAEDIVWDHANSDRGVPWLTPRRGRREVPAFFQAVAQHLQFEKFEVTAIVGDGDIIVALCDVVAVVKKNGRKIVERDEAHVWRFSNGRVVEFRHGVDTARHLAAWSNEP